MNKKILATIVLFLSGCQIFACGPSGTNIPIEAKVKNASTIFIGRVVKEDESLKTIDGATITSEEANKLYKDYLFDERKSSEKKQHPGASIAIWTSSIILIEGVLKGNLVENETIKIEWKREYGSYCIEPEQLAPLGHTAIWIHIETPKEGRSHYLPLPPESENLVQGTLNQYDANQVLQAMSVKARRLNETL